MLVHNVRYALRLLRKAPGFTALAVGTLALGIGANTAVFSVVDAVMLRPLPYGEPDRLVSLWERVGGQDEIANPGFPAARPPVAIPDLEDYARASDLLDGIAGYMFTSKSLTKSGPPEELPAEAVTWNYFQVLGVQPSLGRNFTPDEDRSGAPRVTILTDALWRARFHADPAIVGQEIMLGGEPHTVVGIAPASFEPLARFGMSASASLFVTGAFPPQILTRRGNRLIRAVGRLKEGVSLEQAQERLDAVSTDLAKQFPRTNGQSRAMIAPLATDLVRGVRTSILFLLGAAALVLLVACVNVANLLLVRAIGQRHEMVTRMALGASRRQIVAELFTRALVLALIGGAVGLLCAVWARDLLISAAPATIPRLQEVGLNWRVFAVTLAASVASGLVAGTLSSLHFSKETGPALKATAMTASQTRAVLRWRGVLMAGEIAAAVVLAIGAGLLIRSLATLMAVDLGFAPDRVLVARVSLPPNRYPDTESHLTFFDDLMPRLAALPSVQSAAYANLFPLRGGWGGDISIAGMSDAVSHNVGLQTVGGRYFETLGIPLVSGRFIEDFDRPGMPSVAVVSQTFVRRFVPAGDPLGRTFQVNDSEATIVGVVGEVRREGKTTAIEPQVYLSSEQNERGIGWPAEIAVRASVDARLLTRAVQQQVWTLDPEQPLASVETLDETLSTNIADRRFNTLLLTSLALLALALALVGCYGVVSYAAAQRTREIGIRMAFGADRSSVVGLIVKNGMRWSISGVVAGVCGAIALTRLMRGLLFEVRPVDPWTFAAVAAATVGVSLLASYLPARRAARVEPSAALRVN